MLVFEGLENSGPFLFHVVAGLRGSRGDFIEKIRTFIG